MAKATIKDSPIENTSKATVSVKGIVATVELPRNTQDLEVDRTLYLSNNTGGKTFKAKKRRQVKMSWLIANPVLAIKLDERLAQYTNASKEQIEKIKTTHQRKLVMMFK